MKDIECGILGTDILSTMAVKIDLASRKLFLGGEEISAYEQVSPCKLAMQFVKFGRVYSLKQTVVPPGEEKTVWGRVHSSTTTEYTEIAEMGEEFSDRCGLLGCSTIAVGREGETVLVRVLNITADPVTIYKDQSLAEFTEVDVCNILKRMIMIAIHLT